MKTVLITGGTGFIGHHLIKALHSKGYEIIAMVRKSSNTSSIKNYISKFLYSEIQDSKTIKAELSSIKTDGKVIDFVIHSAALTKAKSAEEFMNINCEATETFAFVVQSLFPNLKKFVFISSLAASGSCLYDEIISLDQKSPLTQYGKSKLLAEERLKKIGIPLVIIRPTVVYGPGEKDLFVLYKNIYKGISPIIGNHKQKLTFIHVQDLIDIILQSVEKPILNKTIFATDDKIYTKFDLANIIEVRSRSKARRIVIPLWIVKILAYGAELISFITKKPGVLSLEKFKELKAQSWNCDMSLTKKELDYNPIYNLKSGMENTLNWYEDQGWLQAK